MEQAQSLEMEIREMRSKLQKPVMEVAEKMRATRGEVQAAEEETSTKSAEPGKEPSFFRLWKKANAQSNHSKAQKMALRKELADKTRPHCEAGYQTDAPPSSETYEIAVQTDSVETNIRQYHSHKCRNLRQEHLSLNDSVVFVTLPNAPLWYKNAVMKSRGWQIATAKSNALLNDMIRT